MKRKIAAALAIVMIGATYTAPFVQAADDTTASVDGESKLAYVNTSKIQVVVPTSAALDFTIDPEGLVSLAEDTGNTTAKPDDLKAYSGRILGNTALIFANKSANDVKVSTKFTVDATGTNVLYDSTGSGSINDKTNSNYLNLQFLAVPTKAAIELEYGDGEEASSSTSLASIDKFDITKFEGAEKGLEIDKTNGAEFETVIPGADILYTADNGTYDYKLDTEKKNEAAGFVISGFCNAYGNYDKFGTDQTAAVSAEYSFKVATDQESADGADATDAYGVITDIATDGVTAPTKTVTNVGNTPAVEEEPVEEEPEVVHTPDTITGTLNFTADKSATVASEFTYYVDATTYKALDSTAPLTLASTDGSITAKPKASMVKMTAAADDEDGCKVIKVTLSAGLNSTTAGNVIKLADQDEVKVTIKFANGDEKIATLKVNVAES